MAAPAATSMTGGAALWQERAFIGRLMLKPLCQSQESKRKIFDLKRLSLLRTGTIACKLQARKLQRPALSEWWSAGRRWHDELRRAHGLPPAGLRHVCFSVSSEWELLWAGNVLQCFALKVIKQASWHAGAGRSRDQSFECAGSLSCHFVAWPCRDAFLILEICQRPLMPIVQMAELSWASGQLVEVLGHVFVSTRVGGISWWSRATDRLWMYGLLLPQFVLVLVVLGGF